MYDYEAMRVATLEIAPNLCVKLSEILNRFEGSELYEIGCRESAESLAHVVRRPFLCVALNRSANACKGLRKIRMVTRAYNRPRDEDLASSILRIPVSLQTSV